jgi:hypothetical protein
MGVDWVDPFKIVRAPLCEVADRRRIQPLLILARNHIVAWVGSQLASPSATGERGSAALGRCRRALAEVGGRL